LLEGRIFDVSGAATSSYRFDTLDVVARAESAKVFGDLDLGSRTLNLHPVPTLDEGVAMLDISGTANLGGTHIGGLPSLIGLQGGRAHRDVLTLVTAATLNGTPADEGAGFRGVQGVSVGYNYVLRTQPGQNGDMSLRMTSARATPQAKVLSEGVLGGMLFVNQGSDLAAGGAMARAAESAERLDGYNVFGTVAGGQQRYDSGSHIDVEGVHLLLGASGGRRLAVGRVTLGAFAEYGDGGYDTHNSLGGTGQAWSLNGAGTIKGRGEARYAGGGILARYEADMGFYTEATARMGSAEMKFKSHDLVDYLGRYAKYDMRRQYIGAHLGVGQEWKIGEKYALGIHGKYFWLCQQGGHTTLSTGDNVTFAAIHSERLRAGLRFSRKASALWSGYAGIAYEHEFDGKAKATANTAVARYTIDAPDVRGGTGIAEVGISMKQSRSIPVSVDIGLQGFDGQRRGIAGSLHVNRAF